MATEPKIMNSRPDSCALPLISSRDRTCGFSCPLATFRIATRPFASQT
jgi:hypothetical protein